MRKNLPAWLALGIIAVLAGSLLGMTNQFTMQPIDEQKLAAANAARAAVLPAAESFEELSLAQDSELDSLYAGTAGGVVVGHTAQVTVTGYGGPIEITVGVDSAGTLVGIEVGGSDFAETAGLGAKAKEPAFTGQFAGLTERAAIGENIDAITAATISSKAVETGVNQAWEGILSLAGSGAPGSAG